MIKPTMQQNERPRKAGGEEDDLYGVAQDSFSVKIVTDDKAVKRLAKQCKLDNIFLSWEPQK
jgi:hypothetical protein